MTTTPDTPAADLKAAAPALSGELRDRLRQATIAARENNGSAELTDDANRRWFVGCANVANRSNVLIQVQRGQDMREEYLPTDTFNPAVADDAIAKLDGALP